MTTDELAEFLAAETKQYVEEAVERATARLEASFAERVERAVEERMQALPTPEPGPKGEPGKDADPAVIERMVGEAVARIPIPEPQHGIDGKDADPEVIRAEVAKAVAALPTPKDGEDGEDGKDVDLLVVKALVDGAVANAVAALPPPAAGKDGVATTDELTKLLNAAVSLAVPEAVEREVTAELGKRPLVVYRGVFQEGEEYCPGNMVTFGGSVWHCDAPTRDKPDPSKAWTLAVKHGRDFRPKEREPLGKR